MIKMFIKKLKKILLLKIMKQLTIRRDRAILSHVAFERSEKNAF